MLVKCYRIGIEGQQGITQNQYKCYKKNVIALIINTNDIFRKKLKKSRKIKKTR